MSKGFFDATCFSLSTTRATTRSVASFVPRVVLEVDQTELVERPEHERRRLAPERRCGSRGRGPRSGWRRQGIEELLLALGELELLRRSISSSRRTTYRFSRRSVSARNSFGSISPAGVEERPIDARQHRQRRDDEPLGEARRWGRTPSARTSTA
jgi:hypothetical protein